MSMTYVYVQYLIAMANVRNTARHWPQFEFTSFQPKVLVSEVKPSAKKQETEEKAESAELLKEAQ